MVKMKKWLAAVLAVVCVLGTAACGAAPQAAAVVLDITSEPANLNQMLVGDIISQTALVHCVSGLTRLNENDEPVADMAESWDINEDNTVYTMHLRKDAKWSNGEPVTANDFYFSWMKQMEPETGSVLAVYLFGNIKNGEAYYNGNAEAADVGLQVVDDYTLRVEWERPTPSGLFYFTLPMYLPVNEKAYTTIGEENYGKDADKMVTNGAYEMTSWTHNDSIEFSKNKDYWNEQNISIPQLKITMIGDANARFNAFSAGELDLCNVYSSQIEQLKEKGMEDSLRSYIDGGTWFLNFNTQAEYTSNANMRRALAYSIDVQSLLDNVIADGSVMADGLVPDVISGVGGESYATARGSLFAYDPVAAQEYFQLALTELGLKAEDVKLVFSATDTTYNQTQAAYIQQQWKENLGLDVEVSVTEWKALSEAKKNGDYTVTCDGWGPTENDPKTFLENCTSGSASNTGKYANPEYDALYEAAMAEGDPAKRQELMISAEKLLISDMAIGPMYFSCTSYAVSSRLEGLVRTPFQLFNACGARVVGE